MKNVIIVGAGGFGREVLQWARDAGWDRGQWRIKGFLDDTPNVPRTEGMGGWPVLGCLDEYSIGPDDFFVCGIGVPRLKKLCVERLLGRCGRFLSLVHPTAVVGASVRVGEGSVICPGAVLTVDVQLGNFAMVNCCSTVGHDARIGNWATLSAHCDVTGGVELGEGVFMGSHASVIPGIKVGDWAVVGAGSTAFWDVPALVTVAGVPARQIMTRD